MDIILSEILLSPFDNQSKHFFRLIQRISLQFSTLLPPRGETGLIFLATCPLHPSLRAGHRNTSKLQPTYALRGRGGQGYPTAVPACVSSLFSLKTSGRFGTTTVGRYRSNVPYIGYPESRGL